MTPGIVSTQATLTSSSGTILATLHRLGAPSLTAALARDRISRARAFHPCRSKQSSSGSRQLVSAVAVVDQGPLQPARETRPTAQQIFDLHHVPHLSPSLVLYFPLGETAQQPGHRVKDTSPATLQLCLMPAGVLLASIRMALWVLLLAADVPWLTDNNTSIAGMPCARSSACLRVCLSVCLFLHKAWFTVPFLRKTTRSVDVLVYICALQCCSEFWESRSTGTILTGYQISDMCLSATT